ncbi:aspartate/glutamate racemase family protein [Photobacterium rosenbergii]|uniref:aspartate/glutamate racemase family protein n=1 Tax=Photobacterium rosenbergii TaxID=294936 RepID=UPI001C99F01F|nr:amino acid racemase [Photobacterium rosenbergii]MBY5946482.1 amino acid racemase [Photobacterium rosenbergii]
MKEIIFGVMGNMGPEADALFQDIVAKEEISQGALKDQDHMGMLVIKNPDIPDRSEAINEGGKDPVPEMVKSAKILEKNNVNYAVMTCNTAHYFREAVQKQTSVYLVDMLKATTEAIKEKKPNAVVGVLCTTGTYNSGIYDRYLDLDGIHFYKLEPEEQESYVHSAIYGKKTGERTDCGQEIREKAGIKSGVFGSNAELLSHAIRSLQLKGVDTIILGCTELPLVRSQLQDNFPSVYFIDPMEVVAKSVVDAYKEAERLIENGLAADTQIRDVKDIKDREDIAAYIAYKALVNIE